ncbi:uncharacterized protein [Medicago truncatula]|uniref:uncharacterized protein n=1 Tax=Medicago truncatula TaxID=3880 RepID=UPI000D2F3E8A|nr:uncharacterized protein LOC112421355 [Medicago truncatula]
MIFKRWPVLNNYDSAANGRIWVSWNPNVLDVKPIASSAQAIHCEVVNLTSSECFNFVAVYAFNTLEQRKELWNFIAHTSAQNSRNLLIGGDFNNVLLVDDRRNGNPVTQHEIQDFSDCLLHNRLSEVRTIGDYYTWCNNQTSGDRIYSKIDRFIANTSWLQKFTNAVDEVLPKGASDHCPISMDMSCPASPKNTPFRFINDLTDHHLFPALIQEKWGPNLHTNLLTNIWFKLKALKKDLKELNSTHFQGIAKKVEDARTALVDVQRQLSSDPMNLDLIEAEKVCLSSLEKWSTIEEKIWMQKSRANWIQLGDSNTKFFHAYAKERRCQNNIKFLITEDDTRIDKHNLIKEEIRGFYLKLMGSSVDSLPMVDKNIVKRGPMLSQHQQDLLCSEFTAVEVKNALFSMDSSKAPGIDGYNVHFFKCSWNIIGDSVIDAILDFFKTGFMPKIINCTYVTLLPKEVNVTSLVVQ